MRKRKILALCLALLVISLTTIACAGAPVNRAFHATAPAAPTSAPPPPGAPMPAMDRQQLRAGSAIFAFGEVAEEAWIATDIDMEVPAPPMGGNGWYGDNFPPVTGGGDSWVNYNVEVIAQAATPQRMIVTTFNLTAETMEFEVIRDFIRATTREFGGYIESSSEEGRSIHFDDMRARSAFFTLRIPSGRVHEFVALMGKHTNIVSTHEQATDITDSFFDNQARLASLVNQEGLLVALLDREDAELWHIMDVHRELANVRHQIEFINTTIQRQEQSVNFSTVHIGLHEVMQYRPVDILPTSFGERTRQAMSNSWNNFVRQMQNTVIDIIWLFPRLIHNLLVLAFWVLVFLLVRWVIRKKKGRVRGQDTFAWLPISRLKGSNAQEKPVTEVDKK